MLDSIPQVVNIAGQEAPDGVGPGGTCAAEEDSRGERGRAAADGAGHTHGCNGPREQQCSQAEPSRSSRICVWAALVPVQGRLWT